MLPEKFKFHLFNTTGATLEFSTQPTPSNVLTVEGKPSYHDSNGKLTYGDVVDLWNAAVADVADDAYITGGEYTNSLSYGVWIVLLRL